MQFLLSRRFAQYCRRLLAPGYLPDTPTIAIFEEPRAATLGGGVACDARAGGEGGSANAGVVGGTTGLVGTVANGAEVASTGTSCGAVNVTTCRPATGAAPRAGVCPPIPLP